MVHREPRLSEAHLQKGATLVIGKGAIRITPSTCSALSFGDTTHVHFIIPRKPLRKLTPTVVQSSLQQVQVMKIPCFEVTRPEAIHLMDPMGSAPGTRIFICLVKNRVFAMVLTRQ